MIAQTLAAIRKALETSGQSLNPTADATKGVLRVKVPKLTREAREQLAKQVGALAEEARKHVRRLRHKALQSVTKVTTHGSKKAGGRKQQAARADDGGDDDDDAAADKVEALPPPKKGKKAAAADEKAPSISEDDAALLEKQVETITKDTIHAIDTAAEAKRAKVMVE